MHAPVGNEIGVRMDSQRGHEPRPAERDSCAVPPHCLRECVANPTRFPQNLVQYNAKLIAAREIVGDAENDTMLDIGLS